MDHLAEVARLTKKLAADQARADATMEARNQAMRVARTERHGPKAISEAADMTPEQVRRICQSEPRRAIDGSAER